MIRGLNKQVIVVRDTGSDYFEEAIFIVDPAVRAADADLAAEAHRLIAASAGRPQHRRSDTGSDSISCGITILLRRRIWRRFSLARRMRWPA